MPLQPADAQNLHGSRTKRMPSTSQPQRTTRPCWGSPVRDGFAAELFQARPEEAFGIRGRGLSWRRAWLHPPQPLRWYGGTLRRSGPPGGERD